MLIQEIYALCMIIMIVSFLGFVVENIWIACTKGFMDNRGMFLPFLLGYGLAVAAIFIVFGIPNKLWFFGNVWNIHNATARKLMYYLIVVICICIGEMLLGLIVEKVCHFSWWNYSRIPLHITQYTSIPTSMAFSVLITIFMDTFFQPLFTCFYNVENKIWTYSGFTLFAFLILDFLYNGYKIYKHHGTIQRWKIETPKLKVAR